MTLESAIGVDKSMSDLNGMDALINEESPSQKEEDVWR